MYNIRHENHELMAAPTRFLCFPLLTLCFHLPTHRLSIPTSVCLYWLRAFLAHRLNAVEIDLELSAAIKRRVSAA